MFRRGNVLVLLPCCLSTLIISATTATTSAGNLSQNWRPPDDNSETMTVAKSFEKRYLPASEIKTSICVPVKESICQTSLYNFTYFPNEWDHATQADAAAQLKRFHWILKSKCSPLLPIFLCIFYFPICSEKALASSYSEIIVMSRLPCTEMCESIRDECFSWLHKNGFDWPTAFSCDKLPPKDGEQECFYPVSNALTLQASKQAFKNMGDAGIVPSHPTSNYYFADDVVTVESNIDVSPKVFDESRREIEDPTGNLVLLVAISVFISLLVLLSVSIALVRCYFQVCSGRTSCGRQRRKRKVAAGKGSSCCGRFFTQAMSSKAPDEESNLKDLRPNSESGQRKKRTWKAADREEQSKSMSVYDVEDSSALLAGSNSNIARAYNHQHALSSIRPRPRPNCQWTGPVYGNILIPPPQSFSFCEGLGQQAERRPSVTWKNSNNGPRRNGSMGMSNSMTFGKTDPDQLSENSNTLPLNKKKSRPAPSLHPISRSQPDLEKAPPVWLRHGCVGPSQMLHPNVTIMKHLRPVQTATVGVGTSPSLYTRKGVAKPDRVKSVIERTFGNISNKNGMNLSNQQQPKNVNSSESLTQASHPDNNDQKRSLTPTKYSITLYLDDAARVTAPAKVEAPSAQEPTNQTSPVPIVVHPNNNNPLPCTSGDHRRNNVTLPTINAMKQQQQLSARELFYV